MQTTAKKIDFDFDPNNFDYDNLVNAHAKPDNKKQVIIDFIKENGIPSKADPMSLFQPNGSAICDPFESYLSNSAFYSTGPFAKLANGTPLDFQYETTDGLKEQIEKYKDRSHFDLGTFVHEAILEPSKWDTVVCEPAASRASHEGLDTLIRFWESQEKALPGIPTDGMKVDAKKQYIADLQASTGLRSIEMKNALIVQRLHERWMQYENGLWANILAAGIREVSMYTDDYNGLPMRIRPDGLLFADQIGVNAVVSVKTTAATTISQYARDFVKFGYNLKESAYQRIASHITGLDFSTTIMIVLSTAEPFHIGVFILNDNEMDGASERFHLSMETAKVCIQSGSYPGWELNAGVGEMGIIDLNVYNN